jgi:hypothetical protein
VPATPGAAVPIAVDEPSSPDTLELDLSKAKIPPGDYHLQATWDWSPLDIGGVPHVHPYGDFAISKSRRNRATNWSPATPSCR